MFSIIVPLDSNRLYQFIYTKRVYDAMSEKKEFIIPTRDASKLRRHFKKYKLGKDVRIIPYTCKVGFNCSKALNIGVREAKYKAVIITSPEVKPITPVLSQLKELLGLNVVCQVFDEKEDGDCSWSLVNRHYKSRTPGMYFLAMFNKTDIEKINGWDEEFMKGYAFEDADFGDRWVRARLPYVMRDDIQGLHQYHPRKPVIPSGWGVNRYRHRENNKAGIIKCRNGLRKLKS